MRLAVCVNLVVLREPVGGGSSLRNRGRLEGGGISPRWPPGREGEGVMAISSGQLCPVLSLISALIMQAAMLA